MNVNSKTANFITKAVGVTGAALCLYSSHVYGRIKSVENARGHKADSITERYLEDMKLDSPSIVKAKAKEGIFHYFIDENFSEFFKGVGGYAKGFGTMLAGNVVPLTLALGAILIPNKGTIRGGLSKLCGAGLVAYGGIFLLQELFGIGKKH